MTDEEWEFLRRFVAPSQPRKGRPAINPRRDLDAMFWMAATRASWRKLPAGFGKFSSIHKRFRRWSESGLWDGILDQIDNDPRSEGGGAETRIGQVALKQNADPTAVGMRAKILGVRALGARNAD
jgi:hypothetical protein